MSTDALVERAWPLRWVIAFILGVGAANLIVGRVVKELPAGGSAAMRASLTLLVAFGALYAAEYLVVRGVARMHGVSFADSVGLRRVAGLGQWIVIACATGLALRLVAIGYSALMIGRGWLLPGWDSNPTKYFPRDLLGAVAMVFVIVIAAPIAEEIVFRGVLLPALLERMEQGWAVAVAAVVFAGMHLNPFALAPVVVVAAVLGVLFIRSRSLVVPIVCHAVFNGLGLALVFLARGQGIV